MGETLIDFLNGLVVSNVLGHPEQTFNVELWVVSLHSLSQGLEIRCHVSHFVLSFSQFVRNLSPLRFELLDFCASLVQHMMKLGWLRIQLFELLTTLPEGGAVRPELRTQQLALLQ